MKKSLIAVSLIALVFTGCKNVKKENKDQQTNPKTETSNTLQKDKNGLSVVAGEYIYTKDAAVINGNSFIYGVVLDSMAEVLAKKIQPLKRSKYDMVPVVVKGKIEPNPMKNGWDQVVAIKQIINITKPTSAPIEIDSKNKKNE